MLFLSLQIRSGLIQLKLHNFDAVFICVNKLMTLELLCVLVNPCQEIIMTLLLDSWNKFIAALLVIII